MATRAGAGPARRVGNTPEFRAALARHLEELRALGVSDAAVERRLHRAIGYLSKLRRGQRDVRPDEVDALARAVDLPEGALAELYRAAGWHYAAARGQEERTSPGDAPRGGAGEHAQVVLGDSGAWDTWEGLRGQIEAESRLVGLGYLDGAAVRLEATRAAVVRFARRGPPGYGRALAQVTHTLAAARAFGGELGEACRLFGAAYALWQQVGDAGGMAGCLMMEALLPLRQRAGAADVAAVAAAADAAEHKLQLVYHRLAARNTHPEIARGHAARDLAWARRQWAPEDTFVDRFLDRAFDHLAATPEPSPWEVAMTHLEAGRVWLDRHEARAAAGEQRAAAAALAHADTALSAASRALPLEVDLLSRLKLQASLADVRYRRGEEERALAVARAALDAARRNGLGLPARDLERLVRRMERSSR